MLDRAVRVLESAMEDPNGPVDRCSERAVRAGVIVRWSAWLSVLALALLTTSFVQRTMGRALRNWDVARGDQGDYLRLALKIADGHGFTSGSYHPLLPFILQPWATRDWRFFTEAKLVNIALAAIALMVVYGLGRRLFGSTPALLAAVALALNYEYYSRSARTEPEILLTLLLFAAWACWALGFADERWWIPAGLLAGMAYLAKGTGQFFLIGFLLVPLLRQGLRGLRRRGPWLLVGLYVLVASPLLVDNWRAFGWPFYDYVSAHAMWFDSWDDRYEAGGRADATALTYVQTHSPREIAERIGEGLWDMVSVWTDVLNSRAVTWGRAAVKLVAALLALLGFIGLHRGQVPGRVGDRATWRDAAWTFGALFIPTYVFFGWYLPVVDSPRFVLPLAPIVYLLLAGLAWAGVSFVSGRLNPLVKPLLAIAVSVVVGLGALWALRTGAWVLPEAIAGSDREQNAAANAVYEHLRTALPSGGMVVWGPGNLARWQFPGQFVGRSVPSDVGTWEQLQAHLDRAGVSFVVVNREMVEQRPFLGRFFRVEDRRVIIDAEPPGWTLELGYPPGEPCKYCVFRVARPAGGER